jgi:hypothetical protein
MNKHGFLANAVLGLAVCMCGGGNLCAQQTPQASGVPVHMVVTVEPHHGADVPAVEPTDVMVFEGKARDQVTEWIPAEGEHAALELFVLLDDGSNANIGSQLETLRQFMDGQPASTKIAVAYMQNGSAKIEQNLTSDHSQASKALRLPMGGAGINGSPYLSLSDLIKHWPESTARREVLMISDGVDRDYGNADLDNPYLQAAIDDAQRAGILVSAIYTPGVGHFDHDYWQRYWGQLYLAEMGDKTGGESYYLGFNGAAVSFSPYLDQLTHRLSHQYLLTFVARPRKKAGWQPIKLRSEVSTVDLVSAYKVYISAAP